MITDRATETKGPRKARKNWEGPKKTNEQQKSSQPGQGTHSQSVEPSAQTDSHFLELKRLVETMHSNFRQEIAEIKTSLNFQHPHPYPYSNQQFLQQFPHQYGPPLPHQLHQQYRQVPHLPPGMSFTPHVSS